MNCRDIQVRRRSRGVLRLSCGGGDRPLAELLTRSLSGPRAWIDVTHSTEPLFGFLERLEVAHVQTEPLASFFKSTTDEKAESLEFGLLGIRQRHGGCRRTEVEDERTRRTLRLGLFNVLTRCRAR
jgi:hypothetical protein